MISGFAEVYPIQLNDLIDDINRKSGEEDLYSSVCFNHGAVQISTWFPRIDGRRPSAMGRFLRFRDNPIQSPQSSCEPSARGLERPFSAQ